MEAGWNDYVDQSAGLISGSACAQRGVYLRRASIAVEYRKLSSEIVDVDVDLGVVKKSLRLCLDAPHQC